MKNSLLSFLAALGLAAVLAAGCGGSGSLTAATPTATPVATPSIACTMPPGESVALAYPPPGPSPSPSFLPYAQGIIIAAAPAPLPTNWYVYAISNLSTPPAATPPAAGGLVTTPPSPFPTPFADPGLANETFQYSPNGVFNTNPGSTWTTYVANTNCFPGVAIPGGVFNS
jgi:hypothetical protein